MLFTSERKTFHDKWTLKNDFNLREASKTHKKTAINVRRKTVKMNY